MSDESDRSDASDKSDRRWCRNTYSIHLNPIFTNLKNYKIRLSFHPPMPCLVTIPQVYEPTGQRANKFLTLRIFELSRFRIIEEGDGIVLTSLTS